MHLHRLGVRWCFRSSEAGLGKKMAIVQKRALHSGRQIRRLGIQCRSIFASPVLSLDLRLLNYGFASSYGASVALIEVVMSDAKLGLTSPSQKWRSGRK